MSISELPFVASSSAASVAAPTDAQLIDLTAFERTEYRRYQLNSLELPDPTTGTVSVFRSAAAWAQPELIKKTIYYFHSGGADDRQLLDVGLPAAIAALSKSQDWGAIQVVCPAIQNSFLSPTLDRWFEQQVRLWAERSTQTTDLSRWIAGVSMGGLVALWKFLSEPSQYTGAAANAPGLLTWNFKEPGEAVAYAQRSGLPIETAQFLESFFSAAFASQDEYDRKDPFRLLAALPRDALCGKSIYLDVGELDQLGLRPTTQQLDLEFSKFKRGRYSFEVVPGALHDASYLATQLQKTFEFIGA